MRDCPGIDPRAMSMASEAGGNAVHCYFDYPANSIPCLSDIIDKLLHFLFNCAVIGEELRFGRQIFECCKGKHWTLGLDPSQFHHKTANLNTELAEEGFGNRSHGNTDCGFTGAGTLQNISHIVMVVFDCS